MSAESARAVLAYSLVTVGMRGITLGSRLRRGLAGACVAVTAALLTAGCHTTTVADVAQAGKAPSPSSAAAASAAAAAAGPVVALGDSYTAGGLLPLDTHATPAGCLRSTRAYPVLVARALGARLTDVACTSAGVNNMTVAQSTSLGTNPPQLSALAPDDRLVLVTLSGDDMGFLNALQKCVKLSFTKPWGSPCATYYGDGPATTLRAETPKIAQLLTAIALRAPYAKIVVVGYPDLFPQSGGCWPAVPITSGDIAYLRTFEVQLNAMLALAARDAGATFVNTYTPTVGHDFCTPERVRDVEGLVPGSLTLPFHPNTSGQAAIAAAVLAVVKG
jgi:lysophospholipase L1-like esterase